MLNSIHIRNFAIIDELNLDFSLGMTALTGETGAGKSILLDAIGLILGDRAENGMVKAGCEKAEIAVTFDLGTLEEARRWLNDNDYEAEDECLIRRIITSDGRSKAYINGNPASLLALKQLGEMLVDIHGQHAHQSLVKKEEQLKLLDNYAGHKELLQATRKHYTQWQQLDQQLQSLKSSQDSSRERLEFLSYQLDELKALSLRENEVTELDEEHSRAANAGRLLQTSQFGLTALYEDEHCVHSILSQVESRLGEFSSIDSKLANIVEMVSSARIQVEEAASELRSYAEHVDVDPERLQYLDERLGTIHTLARKHRVDAKDLWQLQQDIMQEIDSLDCSDERVAALEKQLVALEQQYVEAATALTASRQKAADRLNKGISQAMHELGMTHGKFVVDIQDSGQFGSHGRDHVEFLVSANPGQPPRPLAKVASGGELARISLAIQVMTSNANATPTLIFDEVDSGIGGGVAEVVGRKMRAIASDRQALCVTHLAQVAAQAHHHFKVQKTTDGAHTTTSISVLKDDQRIEEIARMMGGMEITANTLAHAREMVEKAL